MLSLTSPAVFITIVLWIIGWVSFCYTLWIFFLSSVQFLKDSFFGAGFTGAGFGFAGTAD
ncbi:hypothetical protein SD77_2477 [Bacillus badius]|uniref:Uncharacterized protein n=1 Tax=Bacillus badius TaxID=1455 RepID=A0ABR5AZ66_BACBA|nr:hypothetical protein SD78_2064 [Bacillus badius]KIL80023.1 hypothetical protein SD77_2477 [Bacillus badius]